MSATPTPSTSTIPTPPPPAPLASTTKSVPPPATPKSINVFSNDGSFLDRFKKKGTVDEQEKQKQEEAFQRSQALQDRFKKRGKRPPSATPDDSGSASPVGKKVKKDEEEGLTAYEKEVRKLSKGKDLRDEGVGVRPLNK